MSNRRTVAVAFIIAQLLDILDMIDRLRSRFGAATILYAIIHMYGAGAGILL